MKDDLSTADTSASSNSSTAEAYQTERSPGYSIYKPNTRGSGGVMRFGFNRSKGAIFVEAAAQSGEKQFDWDQKIIMKWVLSDIGSALAVLQGRMPQAKLFHQSDKGSSTFELTLRDDPERAPFLMTISRQDASDKSVRKVIIPVSHSEAAILDVALRAASVAILGW